MKLVTNRGLGTTTLSVSVLLAWLSLQGIAQSFAATSEHGVAYDLSGEGRLVVFIHGSNLDRRLWAGQVDHFSGSNKVLTYDLRGLGASAEPTEPYSDVADLARLLDEVGAGNAVLVGLSAGVQVALDFAVSRPSRVDQLVLVSPSLNGYVPDETPAYLPDLIGALRDSDFERANTVLLDSPIMAVPRESADLVRNMVTSSRQWQLPYELVQQSSEPVITKLGEIQTPALVLIGEDDLSAITDLGKLLSRELPNVDLTVIPGGRHLLNLSNPAVFNTELEKILRLVRQ